MEILFSFDTTRKLMIKLFRTYPPDVICVCSGFKRHYALRLLWFLFEINIFEKWKKGDWTEKNI